MQTHLDCDQQIRNDELLWLRCKRLIEHRYEHIKDYYPKVYDVDVAISAGHAGYKVALVIQDDDHAPIKTDSEQVYLEEAIKQSFLRAEIQLAKPTLG